jgi:tripartite-type tricarboxylate transporter receptor subunit TctC
MRHYPSAAKIGLGIAAAAMVAATAVTATPAKADKVADFYKGRDVTVIVGFSVGGSYGAYARMLTRHMAQYVPGKPTMLTKHLQGGGGSRAANYLYNAAPRDGSILGFLADSLAVGQLMFPKKAKYDATKMRYIGRLTPVNPVLMINKNHKVKTIKDAMKTQVIVSCSGRNNQSYMFPKATKELLGVNFKQVCGYAGSAPQTMAQERGDIDAQSSAWISWKIRKWDKIQRGDLIPLIQYGLEREKDLPNIPLPQDLTKDAENKAIFKFLFAGGAVGRTLIAAPGVPMDRVKALRIAFNKTMKDAKFLAAAKKRNANIDPITGEALDKITATVVATKKSLVRQARNIMKGYQKNCKKNCKKKKKKKKKKKSS